MPSVRFPKKEAVAFIIDQFRVGNKTCSPQIAGRIYDRVRGYPYYLQRIPYSIHELSGSPVKSSDYEKALRDVLQEEKPFYQAKLEGLYPVWEAGSPCPLCRTCCKSSFNNVFEAPQPIFPGQHPARPEEPDCPRLHRKKR